MAATHASSSVTTPRLGAGAPEALCPWCGYDLRGIAEGERCPECGTAFGPAEAAVVAARHALRRRAPGICARVVVAPVAIGAALAAFMVIYGAPSAGGAVVASLSAGLPLAALASGLPVVLLSRPWERGAVLLSWLRHAWWLMLAWLSLPALAALVAFTWMLVGKPRESAADTVLLSMIVVAPPWATLTLMGLLAWVGAWHESERHVKHHPRLRALAVCFGALLMLLASIGAALWAGAILAAPVLSQG